MTEAEQPLVKNKSKSIKKSQDIDLKIQKLQVMVTVAKFDERRSSH